MFKTLAATGKLIRVTELDVALGTATPSAEQLATQSDVYQMILNHIRRIFLRHNNPVSLFGHSVIILMNTNIG